MNFDVRSTEFWEPEATQKELLRVFEVCHGCRVCQTLCPSFVDLFQKIDDNFGNVDALSHDQIHHVVDLCYQCKLCYPICPYIPPHEWDIDFPRTMMRAKFVEIRKKGIRFADRLMGDIDRVGTLASLAAPLVNWANKNPAIRGLMERHLGIHKDRLLPDFHSQPFFKWFRKRPRIAPKTTTAPKAALFYTCTVNYNEPQIGKATVAVLEKNGVDYIVPNQQCCGLPFLESGMVDAATRKIKANVETLSKVVKDGYHIVVPSASCSYMLKQDYPRLLPTDDARLVSKNTQDLSEFLVNVHKEGKLDVAFTQNGGKIRYHQPCHLKAQNIGFKTQELLKLIPGAEVARMQCCSGHDGSWSVKKENFGTSMSVGKPLFRFMKAEDCCTTTDCPLSAIQVQQGAGRKPIHPIEVMAQAYGLKVE